MAYQKLIHLMKCCWNRVQLSGMMILADAVRHGLIVLVFKHAEKSSYRQCVVETSACEINHQMVIAYLLIANDDACADRRWLIWSKHSSATQPKPMTMARSCEKKPQKSHRSPDSIEIKLQMLTKSSSPPLREHWRQKMRHQAIESGGDMFV